jgi:hypothetical protein
MSIIRAEQLEQPLDITGSLFGTSSYAATASYALNASNAVDTSVFATTGSNTFVGNQTITGSLNLTGTINGVKQLTQVIYQYGSESPTAFTLVNTTGATFSWEYINRGWYRLSANSSTFIDKRTFVTLSPGFREGTINTGADYIMWYETLDLITIDIFIKRVNGEGEDDVLRQTGFDVKIY